MNNYDEILGRIEELLNEVMCRLCHLETEQSLGIEEDLWDNSDLILNWHVSERTLASWRRKKQISYIQVGSKIWYPKLAREEFLLKSFVDNDGLKEISEDDMDFEISLN